MFTRRQIIALLVPLILEQVLTGLMGIADTMMVTTVGEAAISAVSLVDSINTLVLNLLSALSAGGAIVCAQYLGRRDQAKANDAARQLMVLSLAISVVIMAGVLFFREGMLALIFGTVEPAVMEQALTYLIITGISYPFVAGQQSAAAVFRATGNATPPMVVSAIANMINVAGNAITIFWFDMGVAGAAWATTVSRIFSAVVLMALLRSGNLEVSVRDYYAIRLERPMMRSILGVGIPVGIENSMFQFGKIMVQSTVSTLGTTAMAAQAMIQMLDMFQAMPVLAIGTGLLTVAGQCMGAGRVDELKMYTRKFCIWSQVIVMVNGLAILAVTPLVCKLSGMVGESAKLTWDIMVIITVVKIFIWVLSFVLPSSMRAAGDTKFSTIVSGLSVWIFRVGGSWLLCRVMGVGLIGIWIAWFSDWGCRLVVYVWRYLSGGWMNKKVIQD